MFAGMQESGTIWIAEKVHGAIVETNVELPLLISRAAGVDRSRVLVQAIPRAPNDGHAPVKVTT